MLKLIEPLLLGSLLLGPASPQTLSLEEAAQHFIDQLAAGEFAGATATFDAKMLEAMTAERLEATWKQLTTQVGAFKERGATRSETIGAHRAIFVRCEFERMALDARVVFDGAGQIAGLFFAPAKPPDPKGGEAPSRISSAPYVDPRAFQEEEVTFGKEPWRLPGTLSLPTGQQLIPALVLVHGSGPNDRDETVGANKPFRDLAQGLSTLGIAVLRYEKRTRVHPSRLDARSLTVQEEVIDDALAAVEFLASREEIDAGRIFLLGHSLGGYLAPRIGSSAGSAPIRGLVILAGSTRPLEDLIWDQSVYLTQLDGNVSDSEKERLESLKESVARVKGLSAGGDPADSESLLGASPAYWMDLNQYDPAGTAATLKLPMLILQGERDYQVTLEDFRGWKSTLGGKPTVAFKTYPALNHLFLAGSGPSQPTEYQSAGHVSPEVIVDISDWILGR